jgi:hypothetical protein
MSFGYYRIHIDSHPSKVVVEIPTNVDSGIFLDGNSPYYLALFDVILTVGLDRMVLTTFKVDKKDRRGTVTLELIPTINSDDTILRWNFFDGAVLSHKQLSV